jgi:steroid 5-alpha reductase family enzyme
MKFSNYSVVYPVRGTPQELPELRDYSIEPGWLDLLALFLLLSGSYLNSNSESQRKWWKKDPSNKGRCYTQGLFKYAMHINYFGDTMLFTGWCLFTYTICTLGLPILMAGLFICMHIPGLDAYLSERYGTEFKAYAEKTKKFVPFVY